MQCAGARSSPAVASLQSTAEAGPRPPVDKSFGKVSKKGSLQSVHQAEVLLRFNHVSGRHRFSQGCACGKDYYFPASFVCCRLRIMKV